MQRRNMIMTRRSLVLGIALATLFKMLPIADASAQPAGAAATTVVVYKTPT